MAIVKILFLGIWLVSRAFGRVVKILLGGTWLGTFTFLGLLSSQKTLVILGRFMGDFPFTILLLVLFGLGYTGFMLLPMNKELPDRNSILLFVFAVFGSFCGFMATIFSLILKSPVLASNDKSTARIGGLFLLGYFIACSVIGGKLRKRFLPSSQDGESN